MNEPKIPAPRLASAVNAVRAADHIVSLAERPQEKLDAWAMRGRMLGQYQGLRLLTLSREEIEAHGLEFGGGWRRLMRGEHLQAGDTHLLTRQRGDAIADPGPLSAEEAQEWVRPLPVVIYHRALPPLALFESCMPPGQGLEHGMHLAEERLQRAEAALRLANRGYAEARARYVRTLRMGRAFWRALPGLFFLAFVLWALLGLTGCTPDLTPSEPRPAPVERVTCEREAYRSRLACAAERATCLDEHPEYPYGACSYSAGYCELDVGEVATACWLQHGLPELADFERGRAECRAAVYDCDADILRFLATGVNRPDCLDQLPSLGACEVPMVVR